MKTKSPLSKRGKATSAVKRVKYADWTEMPHPIWGEGGAEWNVHALGITATFPKTIWRKGKYSIIPPCTITHDEWELFDGTDVTRYATLEEAQRAAKGTPLPNNQSL